MPLLNATSIPYTGAPTTNPPLGVSGDFQNIQASPEAFGSTTGRALQGLGNTFERAGDSLASIAIQRQQLFNQVAATDASNQVTDLWSKILYGDPEKGDRGFYGMQGEQALNGFKPTRDSINAVFDKARSQLQNPNQQLEFDREMRRQRAYTLSEMGRHYDKEFRTYTDNTFAAKAKIAEAGMSGAGANEDWEKFDRDLGLNMQAKIDRITARGGSQAEIDEALQESRSTAVLIKTESLAANGKANAALTFLNNNKDAINKLEYPQLVEKYKKAAADQRGDQYVSQVVRGGATQGAIDRISAFAVGNAVPGGPSPITGIHPEFASRIDAMTQAMPEDIRNKFTIISGYRSEARQAQVNPGVTNSHHTGAIAVDTTDDPAVLKWITENGPRFGVGFPLAADPKERNHLEPIENGQRVPPEGMGAWAAKNNFGGLRKAGIEAPPSKGGFMSYPTAQAGIQAISDQLDRYAAGGVVTKMNPEGKPLNTLNDIVSVWAPPNENDTTALIERAVTTTGFSPTEKLDLTKPDVKAKVIEAIIRNEQGNKLPVPKTLIRTVASGPDTVVQQRLSTVPLEQGDLPDSEIPGLQQQLKDLAKTVPADDTAGFIAATKKLRQAANAEYQAKQRELHLHNEKVKATSDLAQDSYMKRFDKEVVPEAQINSDSNLTPEARRTLVSYQRSLNKNDPDPGVDKTNWATLLKRVTAPYGTPDKIVDQQEIINAAVNKDISRTSMENLLSHFNSQKDAATNAVIPKKNQFVNTTKPMIEGPPAFAMMDPDREVRFFNFSNAIDSLVSEYQKTNKDPMDAFKLTDPKDPFSSPAGKVAQQFQAPLRAQLGPAPTGEFNTEQQGRLIPKDPQALTETQRNWYMGNIKNAVGKEISYDQATRLLNGLGIPSRPTSGVPK